MLANKQPSSIHAIPLDCNLVELSGQDQKHVRDSYVVLDTRVPEAVRGENRWGSQKAHRVALAGHGKSYGIAPDGKLLHSTS